jgi:hypothetical protein
LDATEEQPVQIAAVQNKEPAQKKKFVGKKPGGRLPLVNGTSQMQGCKNWICRKRLTLSELWPLIYARESTFQKCKMI